MQDVPQNTMRSLLKGVLVLAVIFLLAYIAAAIWAAFSVRHENDQIRTMVAATTLTSLNKVASEAWGFARPLLQLLLVLVIIEWVLRRVGVQLNTSVQSFKWNVQAIIAIIVIASYAIAELAGIGGGGMKDIALVVVGFYFGTQRHAYEVDPSTGKMRVIDEHDNTIQGGKQTAVHASPPEAGSDPHPESTGSSE